MSDVIFSFRIPFTRREFVLVDCLDEMLPEDGLVQRVEELEAEVYDD